MARLLWPTTIRVEKLPEEIPMDPDFRTPMVDREQLRREGRLIPKEVSAQLVFSRFENQEMGFTGSQEDTDGRAVIKAKDQRKFAFKEGDFIVAFFQRKLNVWQEVELRIIEVKPRGLKNDFEFYYLIFKDEKRA